MAFTDVATLAADVGFRGRIKAALATRAVAALLADPPPAARLARFAGSVLHQIDPMTDRLSWGIAARLDAQGQAATATDAQINAALGHVWEAYAGLDGEVP